MIYEHTQKGGWAFWATLLAAAAVACMFAVLMNTVLADVSDAPLAVGVLAGAAVLGIGTTVWAAVLMSSLTVRVEDECVTVRFGAGAFRKRFALEKIVSCRPVRNEWWAGWGIHYVGAGWLYNVAGLDAVELRMHSGRIARIGTDRPQELAEAVNAAIKASVRRRQNL